MKSNPPTEVKKAFQFNRPSPIQKSLCFESKIAEDPGNFIIRNVGSSGFASHWRMSGGNSAKVHVKPTRRSKERGKLYEARLLYTRMFQMLVGDYELERIDHTYFQQQLSTKRPRKQIRVHELLN